MLSGPMDLQKLEIENGANMFLSEQIQKEFFMKDGFILMDAENGLIGSETKACRGLLCSGSLIPAVSARTPVCPDATTATLLARIKPFDVSTPSIFPFLVLI